MQGVSPLPNGLVDIFAINSNKFQMTFDRSFNWDDQKRWLRDRLARSSAAWRLVVGHHPIEFVPYSILEHTVPGLRWLAATFMTGKPLLKKVYSNSMADVILTGGTDMYMCGHQHLMAHLIREQLPKRLRLLSKPRPNLNCSFVIVGSSSKTEKDLDNPKTVHPRVLRKLQNQKKKMREFWYEESVGFVAVRATAFELHYEFFALDPESGDSRTIYEFR